MFKFMIMMAAASNMVYGSTLSPPRLAQVQQAIECHFNTFNINNDPLWAIWGPFVALQARVDTSVPGAMEKLYKGMKHHPLLKSKSEKACLKQRVCFSSQPVGLSRATAEGRPFLFWKRISFCF